MSDNYKSLERAIREVMLGIGSGDSSLNEEKQSLPMHSKGLLLKHQKAIKKLAAALRLYYSTRLDVIDDEPNLYVPEYDTMINYDSGADTFNPLKDEGTIANSVRNLGNWERITTKAIDDLVKGKYDIMESIELSEATALFPALHHHGIADFGEDSPTFLNALIDANDDTLNQAINQLSKKFKGKDTEIGFIGRPDITAKVKGFAIKKGKFRDGFSSYNYSADLIIKTDKGDIGVITKGVSHMAPPVKLEDSINESRIIIDDL